MPLFPTKLTVRLWPSELQTKVHLNIVAPRPIHLHFQIWKFRRFFENKCEVLSSVGGPRNATRVVSTGFGTESCLRKRGGLDSKKREKAFKDARS